jgi:hypothetical protein
VLEEPVSDTSDRNGTSSVSEQLKTQQQKDEPRHDEPPAHPHMIVTHKPKPDPHNVKKQRE